MQNVDLIFGVYWFINFRRKQNEVNMEMVLRIKVRRTCPLSATYSFIAMVASEAKDII